MASQVFIQSYALGEIGMITYEIILGMMSMAKFPGNPLNMFLWMKLFIDFAASTAASVVLKIDNIYRTFQRNKDGRFVDVDEIVCCTPYRYLKI
ncbi:MAG: hypothetical protein K2G23_07135 [Muribaculaceae bacterium]|nr:hypothetical protein [Muribaculaceae bacterium]